MSTDLTTIGDVLRAYRERAEMTQADIALRLGIHAQSYGTWERGHGAPAHDRDDEIVAMLSKVDGGIDLVSAYRDAADRTRRLAIVNRQRAAPRRNTYHQ